MKKVTLYRLLLFLFKVGVQSADIRRFYISFKVRGVWDSMEITRR